MQYTTTVARQRGALGTIVRLAPAILAVTCSMVEAGGLKLWSARHNGNGRNTEIARAQAVDAAGNVYMTGQTNDDLLTVKFNAQGTVVWTERWNGPANCGDVGRAIALGADGSIHVGGLSYGGPNGNGQKDIITLRYSPEGTRLWTASYPAGDQGWCSGLAIDGEGSTYVVGRKGQGLEYYAVLVKYDGNGQLQWTATLGAEVGRWTEIGGLWVGGDGHIYLAGTANLTSSYRCLLAKYSPAGERNWLVMHPSTASATLTGFAADGAHLYASGAMGTLKYDLNGQLVWALPEPMNLVTVDTDENVFTGTYVYNGEFGPDMVMVKRNPAGVEQWRAMYQSVDDQGYKYHYDTPDGLVVDSTGNLYVSGWSGAHRKGVVLKYDPTGQLAGTWFGNRWVSGSSDLLLDGSNNNLHVIACEDCNSDYDFAAACLNVDGQVVWTASHGVTGSEPDVGYGAALDAANNTYVTGTERNADGSDDLITFKYDAAGQEQWRALYPAAKPIGVELDSAGNIYVVGQTTVESYPDYLVIKYDQTGQQLRVALHSLGQFDYPNDFALDANGSVYVSGNTGVVKFDTDGQVDWTYTTNAKALALDHTDGLYVAMATSPSSYTPTYVLARMTRSGQLLWSVPYRDPACKVTDVAVDSHNQPWITGTCGTEQYTTAGDLLSHSAAPGTALQATPSGGVFVLLSSSWPNPDYAVQKLSVAGSLLWSAVYDGPGHGEDLARDLDCDKNGNVYVTGRSERPEGGNDITTVLFNSNGSLRWAYRHPGPSGNTFSEGTRISVSAAGRAAVAGFIYDGATGNDMVAFVYAHVDSPDLNGDGAVDDADLLLFAGCAMGPNIPGPPGCETSDLDRDGDTDQSDFGVLQRCLGAEVLAENAGCAN